MLSQKGTGSEVLPCFSNLGNVAMYIFVRFCRLSWNSALWGIPVLHLYIFNNITLLFKSDLLAF